MHNLNVTTHNCYIKLVHSQTILLLSLTIPLSTVYSRATAIQNTTSRFTGGCGGAVRCNTWKIFKWANSVQIQ